MNPKLAVLLLCVSLFPAVQVQAKDKTILPDACGDDKVKFDVTTQKNQPQPAPPAAGKAQIVFLETEDKPWGCLGCAIPTSRVGLDGTWVGANKNNSYFVLDVDPGVHHLCADFQSVFGRTRQKAGLTSLTAEAGKVYYFEAKETITVHRYGTGPGSSSERDIDLAFGQLSEDDGKYRLKISALATAKPSN
jgi:hypothetical protein